MDTYKSPKGYIYNLEKFLFFFAEKSPDSDSSWDLCARASSERDDFFILHSGTQAEVEAELEKIENSCNAVLGAMLRLRR